MTIKQLAVATLVAVTTGVSTADEQGPAQFSDAETRMWLTDQLHTIRRATKLTYAFEKSGSLEAGFTDTVDFVISKVNDDSSKAVSLRFFTGERNWPLPPVERATVNLVLKHFLEGDVYEMTRLTDPNGVARERWRYFQRRIKLALAETAEVKPTSFEFNGRDFEGSEIVFEPYVDDPRRDLFARFAAKRYSITVSDDLPGYLYRIDTSVPSPESDEPLLREVLQLVSVQDL